MSSLPAPGSADVLYLVDLSGYVFRAYHAIAPLSTTKGEPTHAVMGTVNMLRKIVGERRPAMFAVAMDSKVGSFRKELDARYKAHRPPAPPDLSQQMVRCREVVAAYNIPVYERDGFEADDLIAAVTKRAVADNVRVVIASADKDLMQLVRDDDDRVQLWDTMRDRVYGPLEVKEKFGVKPSQLRDLLAFMGDTSDNVPGVPGVGPKTAAELIEKFGSLEGVYANIADLKKGKIRDSVIASEADARISRDLVTLREDMDVAWDRAHLAYGGANVDVLRALFLELEFMRLLDDPVLMGKAPPPMGPISSRSRTSGSTPPPSRVRPENQAPLFEGKRTYGTIVTRADLDRVMTEARAAGAIGVSLSTTTDDAMRADIIGLALSSAPGRGYYVPISHRYLGVPAQLSWADVTDSIAPVFADPAIRKVGYALKFTEIVLARKGVTISGAIFDPLLAAYLLDPEAPLSLADLATRELDMTLPTVEAPKEKKRGPQPGFDELEIEIVTPAGAAPAEMALSLNARLRPRIDAENLAPLLDEVELPLSRVLAAMERTGVLVDTDALSVASKRAETELRDLEAKAREAVGHDFAIRSRDQIETILFDELKLPVVKKTPKGGRSTDAAVLEEIADRHPLPNIILEYREIDKLKGTYLDALPRAKNAETGRIHTRFDQAVAATGRLSSNNPNLQNIPIRTELGRQIRAAFVADPGCMVVSADYSQIELRVLAHLSKDEHLVEAFRAAEDVHTLTASLVFDVPKAGVTQEMRRRAKTINFGVIYGMGEAALARQLSITRGEAGLFISNYFARYDGVRRFMEQTVEGARRGEAVRTLLGRRRFLPNLHSSNRGLRFEAERIAKNTPIQGTAADIMKRAMITLGTREVVPGARMVLTVHDELVFEVPKDRVDEAAPRIREAMMNAMKLDVPLEVEVGSGVSWNLAHA